MQQDGFTVDGAEAFASFVDNARPEWHGFS
jgi:hypothetical protein